MNLLHIEFIVPVHKKVDKRYTGSYKQIAPIPKVPNIFEKLLDRWLLLQCSSS